MDELKDFAERHKWIIILLVMIALTIIGFKDWKILFGIVLIGGYCYYEYLQSKKKKVKKVTKKRTKK